MKNLRYFNNITSKNLLRHVLLGLVVLSTSLAFTSNASAQGERASSPGDFDYYLLVLSWSPTYCETQGRGTNDRQCSGARPFSFVLHGLWPQYEQNGWPEMCRTEERPWVPQNIIDGMLDIMPSPRLVIQEYRKHGACSGMDPRGYFDAARTLFKSIQIPDRFKDPSEPISISPGEVQQVFLEANPQLQPGMIEVGCSRNRLRDIRICFSKDLKPRACGKSELSRKLCYSGNLTLPPVRSGEYGERGGPSEYQRRPDRI